MNLEWAVNKAIALFGRYGFGNISDRGTAIAVGQPFVENKVGNATQTNVELFYRFPISDNISITPDLQFIFNPNNNSANGTITVETPQGDGNR